MPRPCTICEHPQRPAIDGFAGSTVPVLRTARKFGIDRQALTRHYMNHMPVDAVAGDENKLGDDAASPREKLLTLIRVMEAQVKAGSARVETLRELRLAYNDLEKLAGGAAPTEVTIREVRGLPEFLEDVFQALEPFPDARMALAAVVRKHTA